MGSVYSVASLAEHWECGTDTIYSMIKSGDLPAFKVGGRLLRIRADVVERFEWQTAGTPSNDTASDMRSSGMKADADTDIRLERLIERPQRPQLVHSGSGAQ